MSKKIPTELKKKTKTGRPITSLTGRLASLHLLLCSGGFARWPLTLRFFSADVYQMWMAHCKKEPGTILPILRIVLDQRLSDEDPVDENANDDQDGAPKKVRKKAMFAANGQGGVQGLDITNAWLEGNVQKTRDVLEKAGSRCDICKQKCDDPQAVVCLHSGCDHTAHLACLSESFLDEEEKKTRVRPVFPIKGSCPACANTTVWGDIVRTLSLRTRVKEKEKPVKAKAATAKPKTTKTTKAKKGKSVAEDPPAAFDSDDEFDIMEPEVSAMDIAEISEEQKMELSMMDLNSSESEEDDDIWAQLQRKRSPSPARGKVKAAKESKKVKKTTPEEKVSKVTKAPKKTKPVTPTKPKKAAKEKAIKEKTPPNPKAKKSTKGVTVIELDSDSD